MSELMIVIPARYQSSRFPGKPLARLLGKPMIQWVIERCRQADAGGRVLVATDDERIYQAVAGLGVEVEMTAAEHQSGTDRLVEIAGRHPETTWFMNVQGDEPDISPLLIDDVAALLRQTTDPRTIISARAPFASRTDFLSPHAVKVVVDHEGRALYFSRSPIPYRRDVPAGEQSFPNQLCWQHIGIYGFHREFLRQLPVFRPGRLEACEKLEQLRWLENGCRIVMIDTDYHGRGIDTPADLEELAKSWKEKENG